MRFLLPILMIIASISAFIFYINPQYKIAAENKAKLANVSEALKKAQQLADVRDKLIEKYKKIDPKDLENIKKMIPDSVENIGLIIELNNITNSMGIELLSPSISNNVPTSVTASSVNVDSKKYGSLSMSFSVNTTYDKFLEFLQELEKTLRLVDITSLGFSAPDPKTGRSTFNVSFDTYWLKVK